MKSLLFFACSWAFAHAASDPVATVVRSSSQSSPEGNFNYGFETDNGISASADGKIKTVGTDEVALEISGFNAFVAPDGQKIETSYIANEFGYQPQGAHLPTPPAPVEIPDYIARALDYIAAHPPKPETYGKTV